MLRMQLCTVGFYPAFRFNKFIQIPSNPLIEFVPHGKLDTVCLSKGRNVFSPSECIVCGGGQLKVWPRCQRFCKPRSCTHHRRHGETKTNNMARIISAAEQSFHYNMSLISCLHRQPTSQKKPEDYVVIYRKCC